jgi:hypothetical protein
MTIVAAWTLQLLPMAQTARGSLAGVFVDGIADCHPLKHFFSSR